MLPEKAREELRKAAQAPANDPDDRDKDIDQAIDQLRKLYPTQFKPEVDNGEIQAGKADRMSRKRG